MQNETTERKGGFAGQSVLTLIACMIVFLSLSGNGAVTPALNAMKVGLWANLPATTISLISNLPSLTAIVGCLVAGAVAGKYISWRVTLVITFAIYLGFGLAPAVFSMTDFYMVLVMRAGYGFGMGMLWTLGNALVLHVYKGAKQGMILGWGQTFQSLGGVVMQIAGGLLASISPNYCYYAYLIAALGLVFTLIGVPKMALERPDKSEKKEKTKIPSTCWGFILLLTLGMMCVAPILVGTSTIMAQRGFGGSAGAGIVTSMYTIGGVCAGLVFGFTWKKFGRYVVPIGYVIMACAMLVVIFANSAIMLSAGLFLAAFAFVQVRPAIYKIVDTLVTPAQVAAMLGVTTAAFNLGTFISTYYMKAVNFLFFGGVEAAENPIWASCFIYLIMAVIMFIFLSVRNKKSSDKE